MIIFTAGLALELPCRTLETSYVFGITTLWTSISSLMCLVWIKPFLAEWSLILFFTWVPLLTLWSGLVRMLFPLALAWWEVCSFMHHQVHLSTLGVTCFMSLAVDFEDSIFLASCLILLAGNFSRSILESLIVLETSSSSLRKNQKISQCKILAVLVGNWQETLQLELHCTTHLLNDCLVWSLSAGQIWP